MNDNFFELPKDLPVPLDDGAAAHLEGMSVVRIALLSTDGATVELGSLAGLFVIYIYPMTGRPGVPLPDGWDGILYRNFKPPFFLARAISPDRWDVNRLSV